MNVGDQLQAVTNDLYISTRHRVLNYTGEERYAVPFFFSPKYETVIKPIPELITGAHVSNYPPVSAGKVSLEMNTLFLFFGSSPNHDSFLIEIATCD